MTSHERTRAAHEILARQGIHPPLAIVAITDGTPTGDRVALMSGCITSQLAVPVRLNFAGDVVGQVALVVEGDMVTAEFPPAVWPHLPRYPALGFRALRVQDVGGVRQIEQCELIELALCDQPNADPRIPPVCVTFQTDEVVRRVKWDDPTA